MQQEEQRLKDSALVRKTDTETEIENGTKTETSETSETTGKTRLNEKNKNCPKVRKRNIFEQHGSKSLKQRLKPPRF